MPAVSDEGVYWDNTGVAGVFGAFFLFFGQKTLLHETNPCKVPANDGQAWTGCHTKMSLTHSRSVISPVWVHEEWGAPHILSIPFVKLRSRAFAFWDGCI